MCCISGKILNFMLVLVLCLVRVQNTIDFKDLNAYLSQIKRSCANIKVNQNLSNYLRYSWSAGTLYSNIIKSLMLFTFLGIKRYTNLLI